MQKDILLTTTILSACILCCDDFHKNLLLKPESPKVKRLSGLCSDCSEFCSITIDFINRESSITKKMLRFCSEVCHKFADELAKTPEHDVNKICFKACRSAAEQCALVY